MAFVVDSSMTMAWCFEDEATTYSETALDRLRAEEAVVPAIWPLEVANVLLVAERRQRITEAQTLRFAQLLQALPITVEEPVLTVAFGAILSLGRGYGLSSYDASYLELAARRGLALATRDQRLIVVAERLGVSLFA